jgi:hypothetical protein
VFGRYLGYSTSEISIFDIAPPHKASDIELVAGEK